MKDPRFVETVILMVQHGVQGAMGVAINRPIGDKSIAEVLTAIGEDAAGAEGTISVFAGGPVQPAAGLIVHSGEFHLSATIALGDELAVTTTPEVLHEIGAGRGPRKRMLMLGYAGWAPQQLEAEMSIRVWVTAVARPELVFDIDRAKVWDAAYGRRTVPL
jgi:putative transcriptional regulator